MSYDTTGYQNQRLFPASVEDRLVGMLGRMFGFALLAGTVFLWLSLITWTSTDPSLTRATSGTAQNLMGPLGAIFSDLILQMLGLAAVVLLLAPMFWAVELVLNRRAIAFRSKLAFYPVSLLLIAGAVSSLPSQANWPLDHGYGGILGDFVFGLGASAFAMINPDRATLATGLVLFAAGFSTVVHSLGLEVKDLIEVMRRPARGWRDSGGTWHTSLRTEANRLKQGVRGAVEDFGPTLSGLTGSLRPSLSQPLSAPETGWTGQMAPQGAQPSVSAARPSTYGPAAVLKPGLDPLPPHPMLPAVTSMAHAAPWGQQLEQSDPSQATDAEPLVDDDEEARGCAIARRFAPANVYQDQEPAVLEPSRSPAAALAAQSPALENSVTPADVGPASVQVPVATVGQPPVQPPAQTQTHAKTPAMFGGKTPLQRTSGYKRPSINMLARPGRAQTGVSPAILKAQAEHLQSVLGDFGVQGAIVDVKPGPVVTLFEFEPARGIKSSRVIGLADDIARSMSAISARVAVVPGRNVIGIELPNANRQAVYLRELFETEAYRSSQAFLPLTLGKTIGGEPIVADLARMPHLLVAGTTGSGKSVGINTMILSILYRHSPEDCRLLMIDPKMLELSVYNDIPHLLTPVVTEPQKAVAALNWVVAEMEERYKRMTKLSVRNIGVYNNRVRNAKTRGERLARTVHTGFDERGQPVYENQEMDHEPMPYIVVVVDEFADLMLVAGKEIEGAIQRLAQMARAAGIHLIMATQRPSVDVITGTIKANFPTRISFKVTSKVDSRTILNEQGAEQLLGQGDMLYAAGNGQTTRVHGPFVADEEVESIAAYLKSLGQPRYVDGVTDVPAESEAAAPARGAGDAKEDLYARAVDIVLRDRKASTSYVQRRLSIGYNRAADLIERMEAEGLISAASSVGKREILAEAPPSRTSDAA
jgi:DNA segregation ATPase FtsK/SpoIIIE, S-DNA-T family